MQRNISDGIRYVQPDELVRAFSNVQRRPNLCLQVHGGHF